MQVLPGHPLADSRIHNQREWTTREANPTVTTRGLKDRKTIQTQYELPVQGLPAT